MLGVRRRAGIRFASEFAAPATRAGARRLRTLRFRQNDARLARVVERDRRRRGRRCGDLDQRHHRAVHPTKLLGRRRVLARGRARSPNARARRRACASGTARRLRRHAREAVGATPRVGCAAGARKAGPRRGRARDDLRGRGRRQWQGADALQGFVWARRRASRCSRPAEQRHDTFAGICDARAAHGPGDLIARWMGDPRPGALSGLSLLVGDLGVRAPAHPRPSSGSEPCPDQPAGAAFCSAYTVIHGQGGGRPDDHRELRRPDRKPLLDPREHRRSRPQHADNDDVMAHELGHRRDFSWADDRVNGHQQVEEVEEAMADMFAYDFDSRPQHRRRLPDELPRRRSSRRGSCRDLARPGRLRRAMERRIPRR